ncbi:MAG TPA: serine/threonine-protein kinase [Polyangiaceae bacterium]
MAAAASGAHVGSYVLCRELGKGAMATVYEARHVQLGKRVALKSMHPHLAADATSAARFLREGKAAAQIHHPNVVDVFDVGMHDGVPFLVMELLDGTDLAALLRERGKLPLRELVDVMIPVFAAVQAAHAVGVIHRDLKPSNVVLARHDDGSLSPTILDFGISKLQDDVIHRDLTASEVLLGTVHYMSPEQTRSGRNASALSDQYALGVMLYECATGLKPFGGNTPYALMHAIVSARVTAPSTLDPELPRSFDDVVVRAMHREPGKRFASVRELGANLLPWASDEVKDRWAGEFGVDASALRPPATRKGVRRLAPALAAAGLLLAGVVGVRALGRGNAAEEPRHLPVASDSAPSPPPPSAEPSASQQAAESATVPADPTAPSTFPPLPRPARPPVRPQTRPTASASAAPPERGTNGALIVE